MLRRHSAAHFRPSIHHQHRLFLSGLKEKFDNFKNRVQAARALSQMSKDLQNEAKTGGTSSGSSTPGMSPFMTKIENMTESQIKQMKQMLELSKNAPSDTPMGKFINANRPKLEQMVASHEASFRENQQLRDKVYGRKTEAVKGSVPKSPTAPTGKAFPTGAKPAATAGKSAPADDPLAPEIEALFAQLREMREKKNKYKSLAEERQKTLDRVNVDLKASNDAVADLRRRLSQAEQNVMLLNSEVTELKEKNLEIKTLQKQLVETKRKMTLAASGDNASKIQEAEDLRLKVAAQEDQIERLNRKLRRSKRSSPLAQFSSLLGDLHGSEEVFSSDAAFAAFRDEYENHLAREWPTVSVRLGQTRCLITTSRESFASRLPHANLDAAITFAGSSAKMKAAFAGQGFDIVDLQGQTCTIAARKGSLPSQALGPYGLAAACLLYQRAADQHKLVGVDTGFQITACHPVVSGQLLANADRAQVKFEAARSSKPGGQASNSCSTKITARLFIDGQHLMQTVSQDSRSAQDNERTAKERLLEETVPQFNRTLSKEVPMISTMWPAAPAQLSQWEALCTEAVESLKASTDPSDVLNLALVETLKLGCTGTG